MAQNNIKERVSEDLVSHNVLARIHKLFESSQWSDCSFSVGEKGESQIFEAHRLLLASCSPVFEAMFYGPLAEKDRIVVPDIEPNIFKLLLGFIYTDVVNIGTVEEAGGVLYAARKYMIPSLSQACRKYLVDSLRPSNVLAIFDFAESMQETDLYDPCIEVMCKYTEDILEAPDNHMSRFTLATLLEQDSLSVSELQLFNASVRWATVECQQRGLQVSGANLRMLLKEAGILCKIRFLALKPEEFADGPQLSGVLTTEEIHALRFGLFDLNYYIVASSDNAVDSEEMDDSADEDDVDKCDTSLLTSIIADEICGEYLLFTDGSSARENRKQVEINFSKVLKRRGLCSNAQARSHAAVKQFCCGRRFLKTAVTISGEMDLKTKVKVSKTIIVHGLRVFTRLIPQVDFAYPSHFSHNYSENIMVTVLDDKDQTLCETSFTDSVEFNSLATISLSEPIRFVVGKEYTVLVSLPHSSAKANEYPLSFMSELETSQGVEFHFCDYADIHRNGSFVRRLDTGFLDTIIFSF